MTVPIGQGFPQAAPVAGAAKGGAGAKTPGNGFSDLLQGADRRPARQADDAATETSASGKENAARKTAGLSPFGAFHPQPGRQPVTGDRSEPASADDEGSDGKDRKSLPDQASVVATIGYAVRHDQPSPAADRRIGDRSGERARTDHSGGTVGVTTSPDAEPVAASGDLSKTPEAPSIAAIAGKAASERSAASPMPPAASEIGRNDTTPGPDGEPDHTVAAAKAPTSPHAFRSVTDRPDRGDRGGANGKDSPHAGGKETGRQDNAVHVVSERSFPAPAAPAASSTVANLAEVLAAARGQPTGAATLAQQHPTVAVSAHTLRIELHPAELGIVTASLKLSGDQLSVELKPETAEAYRHLSKQSDAIASSLKKLGLDVDTVTVMQPSIALTAATRTDAGNQASAMPGRDGSQFQQGMSGGGAGDSGGRQPGGNRGHDGQTLDQAKPAHRGRAGGSVFI